MDRISSSQEKKQVTLEVQNWLKVLAANGSPIPTVTPDGIYGIKTSEAVRIFQGLMGIPQNGNVNYVTFTALKNAYEQVVNKGVSSSPIYPFEYTLKNRRISPGNNMTLVNIIQVMIETLMVSFDGIESQNITGIFDDQTKKNVEYLQNMWNVPVTGEVDIDTWNNLADAYNNNINRE